jgi:tetratricopeptide (TPR) repeat protein
MRPDSDWIRFGTGMVHLKKGNNVKAEEVFNGLIADSPSFPYPYEQLGYIRKIEGETDEANECFRKAIDLMPIDEMGHYHNGLLQVERKELNKAKASFLRVLNLNPSHIDAMVELALVYGREGDFDRASSLVQDLYKKDKSKKDCFARLGWIKAANKDWKGALEISYRDYKKNRISPSWQINIAQLLGRMGEWDRAVDIIKRSYNQNSGIKDGFAKLGWIKFEERQWPGAIELIEKDHRYDRLTPAWLINLALAYGLTNDFVKASNSIEQAYQADITIMDGFSKLGWIGYLVGKGVDFFNGQIKTDETLSRQSIRNPFFQLLHLVAAGTKSVKFNAVETIYCEFKELKNFFSVIGWLYVRIGKAEHGVKLMLRDIELKRMDTNWLPSYAAALGICGRIEDALRVLNQTYTDEPKERKFPIGFKIFPDNIFTISELKQFISKGASHKYHT